MTQEAGLISHRYLPLYGRRLRHFPSSVHPSGKHEVKGAPHFFVGGPGAGGREGGREGGGNVCPSEQRQDGSLAEPEEPVRNLWSGLVNVAGRAGFGVLISDGGGGVDHSRRPSPLLDNSSTRKLSGIACWPIAPRGRTFPPDGAVFLPHIVIPKRGTVFSPYPPEPSLVEVLRLCVCFEVWVESSQGEQKGVPYVSDKAVSSLAGAGASSLLPSPLCPGPLLRALGPSGQGHPWPVRSCRVPQCGASASDAPDGSPQAAALLPQRCQLPAFKNSSIVFF